MKPGPGIELGTIVVTDERSHRCATRAPQIDLFYTSSLFIDNLSLNWSFNLREMAGIEFQSRPPSPRSSWSAPRNESLWLPPFF